MVSDDLEAGRPLVREDLVSEQMEVSLAPPGARCAACKSETMHLIEVRLRGESLALLCEDCEEVLMVNLADSIGGLEGLCGLAAYRKVRAERQWPEPEEAPE